MLRANKDKICLSSHLSNIFLMFGIKLPFRLKFIKDRTEYGNYGQIMASIDKYLRRVFVLQLRGMMGTWQEASIVAGVSLCVVDRNWMIWGIFAPSPDLSRNYSLGWCWWCSVCPLCWQCAVSRRLCSAPHRGTSAGHVGDNQQPGRGRTQTEGIHNNATQEVWN